MDDGVGLRRDRSAFGKFLRTLFREDWVVYAKRPFGGPEHVLHYLARYTHRVANSNHRLADVSDTQVTFRWKDYAHHKRQRMMTLTHEVFLRRFLEHLLTFLRAHIKHVIYIVKENRSYDQILGDLEIGNGDPRLTLFPERLSPNHHAIARSFVTLDNFLVSGEVRLGLVGIGADQRL